METDKIIEGETELLIPSDRKITKKDVVFFNPEMKLSRDLSVWIAKIVKPNNFLDLLAATGARGIRIASEAKVRNVVLNDRNPMAYELIKKNCKKNNLSLDVRCQDANQLLSEERFDFIDVLF